MANVTVSTHLFTGNRYYQISYESRTRDRQTAAATLTEIIAAYKEVLPLITGTPEQLQTLADTKQQEADDIQAGVPGAYTQAEADSAQAEATAAQDVATAAAADIWAK